MKTMKTMTASEAVSEVAKQAEAIKNNGTQRFPESASVGDAWVQGDVYLLKLEAVPKGAKKITARTQIAIGDTQGSRHCLDSLGGVTMYERAEATQLDGPVMLLTKERTLEHPEHGHVVLPPGCYSVTYQRDLDADERERRVQD